MSDSLPTPPQKPIPPTPPIKPIPPQKNKGQKIKKKTGTAAVVSPSAIKGNIRMNVPSQKTSLFYPSLYDGRFTRKQFWCYLLLGKVFMFVIEMSLASLGQIYNSAEDIFAILCLIAGIVYGLFYKLPITVKRIHDLGYSAILPISLMTVTGLVGLWAADNDMLILCLIAGIVCLFFMIWVGFFDSQEGANSYGDSTKYPDLFIKLRGAVLKKDEEKMVFLLKIGAEKYIDRLNKEGISILHVATKNGYAEVIKLLAAAGVNVNKSDKNGETPLNMTSREGNTEVDKLLITEDTDINQVQKDGQTMLHLAARKGNIGDVKLLLSKSADVNVQDRDRRTPLHCAIYNEYIDIAKLLIEAGADFNITDKYGWTPLKAASDKGHTEIVELLKAAGDRK